MGDAQTLGAIAGGSSAVAQTSYTVPAGAGDRKIQVVVDPNNTVNEADKSDNSATATLSVAKPASANLTVLAANITFSPATPVEGQPVTVRAIILNTGSADAGEFAVEIADATGSEDVPIGPQQTVPGIRAGGGATIQVVYDTGGKSGERSIKVTADPGKFIPEERETDNDATASLEIATIAQPNLVVTAGNIGFSPLSPSTDEPVQIRAVVLNHGAVGSQRRRCTVPRHQRRRVYADWDAADDRPDSPWEWRIGAGDVCHGRQAGRANDPSGRRPEQLHRRVRRD